MTDPHDERQRFIDEEAGPKAVVAMANIVKDSKRKMTERKKAVAKLFEVACSNRVINLKAREQFLSVAEYLEGLH